MLAAIQDHFSAEPTYSQSLVILRTLFNAFNFAKTMYATTSQRQLDHPRVRI